MNFDETKIMGILNITPDSFSDGGQFNKPETALARIEEMIDEGVDIIDIGAESTGPGSSDVSADDEMDRLKPIIDALHNKQITNMSFFSIDTYKSSVAEYALANGFDMVNDVTALRGDPDMIGILLKYQPYIVLMYSKDDTPRTSKEDFEYDDVLKTIKVFLIERIATLLEAGFPEDKIIIDPGMGAFISSIPDYSFEVINRLKELKLLGYPILLGISRKSCLGGELSKRDKSSAEWSIKAIQNGADIIRIHNVKLFKEQFNNCYI